MNKDKARPLALVTGALSAAGVDCSRELARRQMDLLLMDADGARLFHLRQQLQSSHGVHVQLFQGHLERPAQRHELLHVLHSVGAKLDAVIFIPELSLEALPGKAEDPVRQLTEKGHLALDALLKGGVLGAMAREGNGFLLGLLPKVYLEESCPLEGPASAAHALLHYLKALTITGKAQGLSVSVGLVESRLTDWLSQAEGASSSSQAPIAQRLIKGLFARRPLINTSAWRHKLMP